VNPPAKNRPIRAIVLFSGAGGSSWGAHKAGIEIVAAIDLWALAGETHKANFPQTEFIHGRLEDVDLAALVKRLARLISSSPRPNAPATVQQKATKPRCEQSKDTAFEVVRFAKAFKCRWLVIENVVGMRRWSRYAEFKKALTELGYKLREQVLNAAAFGVAQSRRRLFLVADRNQEPEEVKPESAPSEMLPNRELKWALQVDASEETETGKGYA